MSSLDKIKVLISKDIEFFQKEYKIALNSNVKLINSITQKILTPLILTIPIFFSGLAFSKQLSIEKTVSIALSSNILGAIFGGLIEYNSMYFGFRSLNILGFAMYFAAFIFSKKNI